MRGSKLFPGICVLAVLCAAGMAYAQSDQLRQIAILDLPGRPSFGASTFARGHLVIAHPGAKAVSVFDPARRRLQTQIDGFVNPRHLAVQEERGSLYVSDAGRQRIVAVSLEDWTVQSEIALDFAPDAILPAPARQGFYVTHWRSPALSLVSAERGQARRLDLEGRVARLAWDAQRGVLWATLPDRAEVVAITPELEVEARYRLTASQPTGLALDTTTRRLYVAVRYAIVELDADSGEERARIAAPRGTDQLWMDEEGRTLLAAASDGTVLMVNIAGERPVRIHELRTEVRGRSLAFDTERRMVYLPGGRQGRSKLLLLQRLPAANAAQAGPR